MTLAERLRQECDILRLMQAEHLRLSNHALGQWEATKNQKFLHIAIKSNHYWQFNEELIERYETILKDYE